MFRTDCVDRNGTRILDLSVGKIFQHKGAHYYAMHTLPIFFVFI
jgi:hypothetical protein